MITGIPPVPFGAHSYLLATAWIVVAIAAVVITIWVLWTGKR